MIRRLLVAAATAAGALAGCTVPRTAPPEPPIRFVEAADEAGVRWVSGNTGVTPLNITRLMAGGVGLADLDGDHRLDLVLTGTRGVRVYRNTGPWRMEDVTGRTGIETGNTVPQGLGIADWTGDGLPDLAVTALDGVRGWRNLGGFRFEAVPDRVLPRLGRWCGAAAFGDADGDGRLDLYVGRYLRFGPGSPEFHRDGDALLTLGPEAYPADRGVLLRNRGDRFEDGTAGAGLDATAGKNLGAAWADFDRDGDQDLYLANDGTPGDLFVNDGSGRFRNLGLESGTSASGSGTRQAGMGVDWEDVDRDGRLDLLVTTFFNEPKSLYRQEADGSFTECGPRFGLLPHRLRWTAFGAAFADWDNDGWSDLLVANGHVADQFDRVDPDTGYRQPTQLFRSEAGQFVEVDGGPDLRKRIVGRGLAVGDLDGDGRLDAVVGNLGGPPLVLRNLSAAGNWIRVHLEQTGPNRAAIGGRVARITPAGRREREVQVSRSYFSAFPAEVTFGLGPETAADLEVTWPGGTRSRYRGVPANRCYRLRKGDPTPHPCAP